MANIIENIFLPRFGKFFNHRRLVLELSFPDPPLHLPRRHTAFLSQGRDPIVRELLVQEVPLKDRVRARRSVH